MHDDIWTFNSQVSSQWDGLRHYGYQKEAKFYGGVTVEDIQGEGGHGRDKDGKKTLVNGIQGMIGPCFPCLLTLYPKTLARTCSSKCIWTPD